MQSMASSKISITSLPASLREQSIFFDFENFLNEPDGEKEKENELNLKTQNSVTNKDFKSFRQELSSLKLVPPLPSENDDASGENEMRNLVTVSKEEQKSVYFDQFDLKNKPVKLNRDNKRKFNFRLAGCFQDFNLRYTNQFIYCFALNWFACFCSPCLTVFNYWRIKPMNNDQKESTFKITLTLSWKCIMLFLISTCLVIGLLLNYLAVRNLAGLQPLPFSIQKDLINFEVIDNYETSSLARAIKNSNNIFSWLFPKIWFLVVFILILIAHADLRVRVAKRRGIKILNEFAFFVSQCQIACCYFCCSNVQLQRELDLDDQDSCLIV